MKKAFGLLLGILMSCGIYSCTDDTIGSSITNTGLEIVADSSFTVSGNSVRNEKILTRTMTQLLGSINIKNFGELNSDFVCQFLPTTTLDTTGVTAEMIDSIRLIMRTPIGEYVGDSVMPMRVNVYQLNKQLKAPINSTFNPEGYYNPKDLIGSSSYTATMNGSPNLVHSNIEKSYYRTIVMTLPKELAVNIFNEYKTNPAIFQSPKAFNDFFPGIYATNSYGSGRIMKIDKTLMLVNYRRKTTTEEGNDTIVCDSASYASAAPEVITNNNITLKINDNITTKVNNGEAILQAPVGYDVEVNFPLEEIINKYNEDSKYLRVVNSLYFSIPVNEIENNYNITPPPYLLLIKSADRDKFFANNKIADNETTFYATYDNVNKCYIFGNMRKYFLDLYNSVEELKTNNANDDEIADKIEEASKMLLVPIDVISETSSSSSYYYYYTNSTTTITSMTPAVSKPTIGIADFENAKIAFVYSKQLQR